MKLLLIIAAVILALFSSALYAGTATTANVTIEFFTEDSGEAGGSMWPARSSKNDVETIGCFYAGVDGYNWVRCFARDADGLSVRCATDNPSMMDVAKNISSFSWVRFDFENAVYNENYDRWEGDCTLIASSTRSQHLPFFTTRGKK